MVSINSSPCNGKFREFERDKKKESRERDVKIYSKWTSGYFFIENTNSKPLCLIYNQTVNVNKEYSIKQHYDSKHADGVYGKLKERDRELKIKQLQEQLKSQCFMFQKMRTDNEKIVRCSFLIAQGIAQTIKPYSKGDFVKKCLTDVAEEMWDLVQNRP